tara:strand:- start:385 stop:606 length:222 start_codon:yes stop_codon:yes gene_type:complete
LLKLSISILIIAIFYINEYYRRSKNNGNSNIINQAKEEIKNAYVISALKNIDLSELEPQLSTTFEKEQLFLNP